MVDHHPYRLRFAHQTYGVIPVNFDEVDAAEFIIQNTAGYRGVDAVIDAVGFEAKGSMLETVMTNLKLEGSSGSALRQCIAAVRRGGVVKIGRASCRERVESGGVAGGVKKNRRRRET